MKRAQKQEKLCGNGSMNTEVCGHKPRDTWDTWRLMDVSRASKGTQSATLGFNCLLGLGWAYSIPGNGHSGLLYVQLCIQCCSFGCQCGHFCQDLSPVGQSPAGFPFSCIYSVRRTREGCGVCVMCPATLPDGPEPSSASQQVISVETTHKQPLRSLFYFLPRLMCRLL